MPTTKIINVSKSDDFEDIFALFKSSDAEEVIFIFPKGSRFAKQEQYFEALKKEADQSGKKVSIMSTDPIVAQMAFAHGLDLLADSPNATAKKRHASVPIPAPISVEQAEEPNAEAEEIETGTAEPAVVLNDAVGVNENQETITAEALPDEDPDVTLAASKSAPESAQTIQGKTIRDILKSEPDHPLKIKEEKTRAFEVDIKSNLQESSGNDIAKVWAAREEKDRKSFLVPHPKLKFSRFLKKKPLIIIGGVVLVLLLILYGTLGSARITVHPKKQDLTFQLKISASIAANSVSPEFARIPGQRFIDAEEESGTFPASGQKDIAQKAGGKITIFNKSFVSQRLVATTRFKTPDGLIFRIPQTITVPAATKTDSTTKEGAIESPVYADKPGPEYNIGPTQFTIPGFEGTPKVNDFYAKSDQPMSGGIIGPSKVVTEEDFAKAQESLTAKLKDKILKTLKGQAGELKILDSTLIKFETPITNAAVGGSAENLQMTVKGSAEIIAFRETDVLMLIKDYVEKNGDVELLSKNLAINYENPQMSADNSTLSFGAQVSGQAAAKVDTNKILQDIPGMKENDIRSYFGGIKEIDSVRVILSPFWVKSIPKDPEKVKIGVDTN